MKRECFFLLLCFFTLLSCSCAKTQQTPYAGMYIFCVNTTETQVVGEKYTLKSQGAERQIEEFLEQLRKEPKDISLKKAIPDDLVLKEYTLSDAGDLSVYWTTSYMNYSGVSEVLRRAAMVKTLCQVEAVHTVEFYVAGQPWTGFMTADTFIDNTGEQVYRQKMTLNLYFSSEDGEHLKRVPVAFTYDATIPMEQLAVEQLIKGPEAVSDLTEKNLMRTISASTKLNKISIRENTCYLDLSKEFLEKLPKVASEVTVYSLVNTLTDLSNINRVQISIDGEQNLSFNDQVSFGKLLEMNLNLVE